MIFRSQNNSRLFNFEHKNIVINTFVITQTSSCIASVFPLVKWEQQNLIKFLWSIIIYTWYMINIQYMLVILVVVLSLPHFNIKHMAYLIAKMAIILHPSLYSCPLQCGFIASPQLALWLAFRNRMQQRCHLPYTVSHCL